DTRRAKRLFPLFGSGAILGSVVGGLVTGPLARAIGVGNLLLVWAACLLGASVLATVVLGVRRPARVGRRRARRRSSAMRDLAEGLSFVRRSPLLMWMTAAGVLFSVLFYSLFLPFAQAATARYPDPEALAGFLGVFVAGVTIVAFLISILLLAVAGVTIGAAWRIRRSYAGALVDALRAGRPSVFEGRPVQGTPVVLELDATAIGLALEASRDPDPRVRRLGVELLASGD